MSSIAIPSSAASVLPATNIHPHGHGHGHKKGSEVDALSGDSSSSTAAQAPAGSSQNIFGSLLSTLEQVIGVQPQTRTAQSAAPAQAAQASQTAQATQQSIGSKLNMVA